MDTQTLARPATGLAHVPSFFDPANAGKWDYRPDQRMTVQEAIEARSSLRLKAAATDRKRVNLLLIDMEKDFNLPQGTLFVGGRSGTGGIDDSRRVAEFIYRNIGVISEIDPTLDTHVPFQIFFPSFWEKEDGSAVLPNTVISADDVRRGHYRPALIVSSVLRVDPAWLTAYVLHYCETLEREGKYQLYIWPEHCLLGSAGHTLVGLIEEAALYHAIARGSQTNFQIKGGNPLTENYSVLRPEVLVRHDGGSLGQKNVKFIETLLTSDYVIIAGEAASHCVASSIDDLLTEIMAKDPALAQKVYLMEDCMSAVAIPDGQGGFIVDFTPQAEAALAKFAAAGMHVVKSTDSVDTWPDFVL